MSLFDKPLFRPEAVRPKLAAFPIPAAVTAARVGLVTWAKKLGTKAVEKEKETELLPYFVTDVFENVLGYVGPPASPFSIKREKFVAVDGKFADAVLGHFGKVTDTVVAVLEGKGPKDPLDRP